MCHWSQRYFAHVTTVTLSWRVQHFVVIGRICHEQENYKISPHFDFNRNIVSETGGLPQCTYSWDGTCLLFILSFYNSNLLGTFNLQQKPRNVNTQHGNRHWTKGNRFSYLAQKYAYILRCFSFVTLTVPIEFMLAHLFNKYFMFALPVASFPDVD